MKKNILTLLFSLSALISIACDQGTLTIVTAPVDIGGGQFRTVARVCLAQVNNGGTANFTVTVNGATLVSYLPLSLTNTYNAVTLATCDKKGCVLTGCGSVTATANSSSTGNVTSYSTNGSVPAGFPLTPATGDQNAACGANPSQYCFNYTVVTTGRPTSIVLGGGLEARNYISACVNTGSPFCAIPAPVGSCPSVTLSLPVPLPVELISWSGKFKNEINHLTWTTASEKDNDYFFIERSTDGKVWTNIGRISAGGNSTAQLSYDFYDGGFKNSLNYYRLAQVDFDGEIESFDIITIDNSETKKNIEKRYNLMGQELSEEAYLYYNGIVIMKYEDGTSVRFMKHSGF